MKRLRADGRGIEGLPLRLLVGMAALILALPPAVSAFESVQKQMAIDRAETALDGFLLASKQVALGGEGGVRIVSMDLDMNGLEYVSIGGGPDSGYRSSSVAYKMSGSQEVSRSTHDPLFFMVSKEGSTLLLGPGTHRLKMTAVENEDFTGDGIPDRAVLVENCRPGSP